MANGNSSTDVYPNEMPPEEFVSNYFDQAISASTHNDQNPELDEIPSTTKIDQNVPDSGRFRSLTSFTSCLSWNKTSPQLLERAERRIFDTLKSQFNGRSVPIMNNSDTIWTVYHNQAKNIPIVLIHGFGGGLGLWALNLDQLCEQRPVYCIDLPGFGRSSRPVFSLDAKEAEQQFVDMIEDWRNQMDLNEFILLGHSFGGYLAAAYTLRHPQFIKQLILVDPWGMPRKPDNLWENHFKKKPYWFRPMSSIVMKFSPLAVLRAAGPLGIRVMKYFRPDLRAKFEKLFDDDRIFEYLYHCNAQTPPTGEAAFKTIADFLGWAKEPMIERIHLIDEHVPIHFLHGDHSWISNESSAIAKMNRPNSLVTIDIVQKSGHHVYADNPEQFEQYLQKTLLNM